MASSRHLPLSYNTSTFGGVTRDYQSLSVWEAATDNDLVTATDGEVLDCYADSASYDQSVIIGGATTDSDYFRVVRAAAGQKHSGIPGSGFQLVKSEDGTAAVFSIRESYVQIQDIVTTQTGNSASTRFSIRVSLAAVSGVGIIGCLAKSSNSGAGVGYGFYCAVASSYTVVNSLFYECKTDGIYHLAGTSNIYNNTIVDNGDDGVDFSGGTMFLKNCVVQGNGTNIEGSPTETTNAISGVVFIDAANDNYFLDPSDTVAQGQGTNLSADANYAFDDDVIGATRPFGTEWDIGFEECCDVELSGSGINSLGMTLTMN